MKLNDLETERLSLRKLTPEVYKTLFTSFSDGEIMDFLGLKSVGELNNEKEKFHKGLSTYNRSFVWFLLFHKEAKEIIGSCGFHTWYTDHNRAEIGYSLKNDLYKNQGLMKEAIDPAINYGFEVMKLYRIEAFVAPDNTPSLKLMEYFGFTKEGHLREHYLKNNVMEDSVVFSLLKSEYKRLK